MTEGTGGVKHSLRRTNPKGQPFVGTCVNCGKSGLTLKDMARDECENLRRVTEDEAIVEAIKGTVQ